MRMHFILEIMEDNRDEFKRKFLSFADYLCHSYIQ